MFRYELHVVGAFQRKQPFFPLPLADYDEVWILNQKTFSLEEARVNFTLEEIDKNNGIVSISLQNGFRLQIKVGESVPFHLDYEGDEELDLTLTLSAAEAGEEHYDEGFYLLIKDFCHIEEGEKVTDGKDAYEAPLEIGKSVYLKNVDQHLTVVGLFPSAFRILVKIGPKPGQGKTYEVFEHKDGGYKYLDSSGAYENFFYVEKEVFLSLRKR